MISDLTVRKCLDKNIKNPCTLINVIKIIKTFVIIGAIL